METREEELNLIPVAVLDNRENGDESVCSSASISSSSSKEVFHCFSFVL